MVIGMAREDSAKLTVVESGDPASVMAPLPGPGGGGSIGTEKSGAASSRRRLCAA